jgi:hypothetical protein
MYMCIDTNLFVEIVNVVRLDSQGKSTFNSIKVRIDRRRVEASSTTRIQSVGGGESDVETGSLKGSSPTARRVMSDKFFDLCTKAELVDRASRCSTVAHPCSQSKSLGIREETLVCVSILGCSS